MRRLLAAALVATAAAAALPSGAVAAGHVCAAPTHLKFTRSPGAASGRLSWQPPHGARRGMRFRVFRDGAVIGQTRRSWMKVRVSVGQRYRFAVRPVTPRGRLLPCSAGVRKLIPYVPPTTPRNFAVTGTSGPAAHLDWSPSKRGDGRVTAYRVLRSGLTYKQVRATQIDVPISNNRSYQFAVQAVDTHGKLSHATKTVKVETGHQPPPAPATVIATDVSDTELTLSWSPSTPARGTIAGYRVYRDGKVLRQVKSLTTRVTGLAASASHVFTVAAVDSSGWLSSPSAPASVSTAPPIPSTGTAQAFLLASTGRSFADFRANYRQIGVVYPTYFDCSAAGTLTGKDDPLVTHWAQQRAVKVLPRFNCQREDVVHNVLTDANVREYWLDQMVATVEQNGYDGVQMDFEKGLAADRGAMTSFVTELAARLHAHGRLLSVAVSPKVADVPNHPRSSAFDYIALAQQADWVFVMAWGIHWQTSAPGAVDDLTWFNRVMAYMDTLPDHGRYVVGTQLYGLDWANGGGTSNPAVPYEWSDAQALAARVGATPHRDATTDNWTFSYQDGNGSPHEVWYTDSATSHTRIQMARDRGFGVGFWRLGNEDQRLWSDPLIQP